MNEKHPARRRRLEPSPWLVGAILLSLGALAWIGTKLFAATRHVQLQNDPNVATVWVIGATFGSQQILTRGGLLQKELNRIGVHALGDYQKLPSGHSGDPAGVEIWFDYASHISGQELLECHRLGKTAFVDDLGQPYHGFLDFHNKIVGVYLPGYDHAAHKLYCNVHWMPRSKTYPVSIPMRFVIDLPPAKRVLPPAASLPQGPISQTAQGVTVTVNSALLSPPQINVSYQTKQRTLTLRLRVRGGEPADDNVTGSNGWGPDLSRALLSSQNAAVNLQRALVKGRLLRSGNVIYFSSGAINTPPPSVNAKAPTSIPPSIAFQQSSLIPPLGARTALSCKITDPYGVPLLYDGSSLNGSGFNDLTRPSVTSIDDEIVFNAPVNGAGKGTDVIRFHLDVHPKNAPANKTVPFDLVIPVRLAASNSANDPQE